jgi:hypothetical protein
MEKLGHIGIKRFGASKTDIEDIGKPINLLLISVYRKVEKHCKLVMDEIEKEPIEKWVGRCENKNLL